MFQQKRHKFIMLWILPRRHHRIMPPLEVIRSQNESSNDPLLTTNTTNTTLQLKRAVPLASFAVHRPTRTGWVWVYVYTKSSPEKLDSREIWDDWKPLLYRRRDVVFCWCLFFPCLEIWPLTVVSLKSWSCRIIVIASLTNRCFVIRHDVRARNLLTTFVLVTVGVVDDDDYYYH